MLTNPVAPLIAAVALAGGAQRRAKIACLLLQNQGNELRILRNETSPGLNWATAFGQKADNRSRPGYGELPPESARIAVDKLYTHCTPLEKMGSNKLFRPLNRMDYLPLGVSPISVFSQELHPSQIPGGKKMLRTTLLAAIFGGVLMASLPTHASLMFNFSFGGFCDGCDPSEEPGTVEGIIEGLLDDQSDQAATSVVVTSAPGFLSSLVGEDFADIGAGELLARNSFSVVSGTITTFEFVFLRSTSPVVSLCLNDTAGLCSFEASALIVEGAGQVRTQGAPGLDGVAFAQIDIGNQQPVPIPATAALLAIGLLTLKRFNRMN